MDGGVLIGIQSLEMTRKLSSFLLFFALTTAIFGLCAGPLWLWDRQGLEVSPAASVTLWFCAALGLLALLLVRFRVGSLTVNLQGCGAGLALVFVSDWLTRGYSFFQAPSIRGEIIVCSLVSLGLLAHKRQWIWVAVSVLTLILLAACFFVTSGGHVLFSDDHATFIFRLNLLVENFPNIPHYHPLWNAGIDARDFFATGALNAFLLSWPLTFFLDVWSAYNVIIALILFGLFPLSVWYAGKLLGLSPKASSIAVILVVCSGLIWYRWALKYGTVGFLTTAAIMPAVLALAFVALDREKNLTLRQAILLVLAGTLMLFWSPSGFVFLPLGLYALLYARTLLRKKYVLAVLVSLVLLNAPWMIMFWSVSKVGSFLRSEKATHGLMYSQSSESEPALYRHEPDGFDLAKSLKVMRETAISTNPLILVWLLPGIMLLGGQVRWLFALLSVWLIFLGSILVPVKPQLEFDRMLLLLTLLGSLPCGVALERFFRVKSSVRASLLPALSAGFLLCSPFVTGAVLLNRSVEHYYFATPVVEHLVERIRNLGGGGRVLFSGFVLHEYNGGHIAPLALMTGKPMVASSPFHKLWRYTDVIPVSFRQRHDQGIDEYLDLMNVSSVISHERQWRQYFDSRPDAFELVWREERFSFFVRKNFKSNWFVEGDGELLVQDTNSVRFRVDSPSAVVKFTYFPFLEAPGCTVAEERVAPEVGLVRLSGCTPGTEVTLRSVSPLRRLLMELRGP